MHDRDVKAYMQKMGENARSTSRIIATAATDTKNRALTEIAGVVQQSRPSLRAENDLDLQAGRESGLSDAMLDRLALTDARIDALLEGLQQVVALSDPVGELSDLKYRPSGIQVGRMRVPLGVVGIIFESRPDVTVDAASLCIKSGNACILRGGSEAIHSNRALGNCIQEGLKRSGLPTEVVQLVATADRAAVGELITMDEYVDVIVPRGGKGLIARITAEARIAVIKHLDGVCHVYIDDKADREKAINIAVNAKTQRYGVCNSMETLLVARQVAESILPELADLYCRAGVELRGCNRCRELLPSVGATVEEDWETEYLAPILSIKVVDGLDEAIDHINRFGSKHTDAIVTEDYTRGRRFLREVDSSSVLINASTRFSDGFEYGLGAEIGISTDKIHARGPVGLEGLTSQKYVVFGDGQIRE